MSPSHFAILFIIVISLVPLHGSGNTQHHNANKPAPNAQAVDASKSAGDKTHSFDANKLQTHKLLTRPNQMQTGKVLTRTS
nr:unknown protein [Arabidopsis thaliana]AAT06403.1 At2g29790 [Arabidopsis thaliana]